MPPIKSMPQRFFRTLLGLTAIQNPVGNVNQPDHQRRHEAYDRRQMYAQSLREEQLPQDPDQRGIQAEQMKPCPEILAQIEYETGDRDTPRLGTFRCTRAPPPI